MLTTLLLSFMVSHAPVTSSCQRGLNVEVTYANGNHGVLCPDGTRVVTDSEGRNIHVRQPDGSILVYEDGVLAYRL